MPPAIISFLPVFFAISMASINPLVGPMREMIMRWPSGLFTLFCNWYLCSGTELFTYCHQPGMCLCCSCIHLAQGLKIKLRGLRFKNQWNDLVSKAAM